MAQPNIAMLPEISRLLEQTDTSALPRDIQLELVRLGCFSGNIDGAWGKPSKDAVAKFNRYAHVKLSANEPSSELISALRQHEERVCPLICQRGYRASANNCVAVEREPVPSKKERRAQERREHAKASARASAEPKPAPRAPTLKPAAASKTEFASPLCESRIQVASGKWCCTYDPPRGPSIIICR
jgi:hypothetical protein